MTDEQFEKHMEAMNSIKNSIADLHTHIVENSTTPNAILKTLKEVNESIKKLPKQE